MWRKGNSNISRRLGIIAYLLKELEIMAEKVDIGIGKFDVLVRSRRDLVNQEFEKGAYCFFLGRIDFTPTSCYPMWCLSDTST
jgi:hypothetical protein